jgi:dynamin 1-like protein
MGIITERLNANKPPPTVPDPKSGKLAAGQINNNKDLDVDSKKEEPSFFGSFFAGKKATKKGPNTPVMESVSLDCERAWR